MITKQGKDWIQMNQIQFKNKKIKNKYQNLNPN